jgi:hypothetical protein
MQKSQFVKIRNLREKGKSRIKHKIAFSGALLLTQIKICSSQLESSGRISFLVKLVLRGTGVGLLPITLIVDPRFHIIELSHQQITLICKYAALEPKM